MNIDHIGIVVKSMQSAIELWQNTFGYEQMTKMIVNTRQKVKVVFMRKENSIDIKLIEPTDRTSPIYVMAQKGGGLHHLCFMCDDLRSQLEHLQKQGLRVLTPPEPGEAFQGEEIAFLFAGQGLNVELIDTSKRAGMLSNSKRVK